MEKSDPAIRIFKRRDANGEIVGWGADIKIPDLNLQADEAGYKRAVPESQRGLIP